MNLALLYRGPLKSCNYSCGYCPFAKHDSPADELAEDELALARLVDWATAQTNQRLSFLFTPWGEGLIRPWYADALTALSRLQHVERVAIQTNLTGDLDWLQQTDTTRLALWVSFHPRQVKLERFVARCRRLDAAGVRYSVGAVGLRQHLGAIQTLRALLSDQIYLWINAYKEGGDGYYGDTDIAALAAIDPLFPLNLRPHPSQGQPCRAGASVISVDGAGDVRRCHFVDKVLGNLYRDELESLLDQSPCPNSTCHCHIGYVHLDALELYPVFGQGVLERVPQTPIWRRQDDSATALPGGLEAL